MNGTFGECWIDNDYMAETTALEATVKLDTTEVTRTGTLEKGYKVTGITCSGTLKLNKVTSYMLKKIGDNLKKGKATRATIISNIEDPEAFGAERIRLDDVVFTEIKLADWEAGKLLEESIPFSFSGWEVLESIDV
ncbi:phage tail tube protein [Blautia massiliensis (ex Durand et al. 2017)]|uniref:phage tail tube protein n=1 Tax=Lachnospiraceae TaxID=186803 RepID=UPI003FA4793C